MRFSFLMLSMILTDGPLARAASTSLRVTTYNLWHGLGPGRMGSYVPLEAPGRIIERRREQLEIMRSEAPDVAFFQEANRLPGRAHELAAELDARADVQLDAAGLKLLGLGIPMAMNGGLATTVSLRHPSRSVGAIPLSHGGPNLLRERASLQWREERFALLSEVVLHDGAKILLVNTHLHDGFELTPAYAKRVADLWGPAEIPLDVRARLASGDRRRRRELHRLLTRVRALEDEYAAVVIGGDFNATPDGETYRLLTEAGYRDAWREANPQDQGLTFDFDRNRANRLCQQDLALPIDLRRLDISKEKRMALAALVRESENSSRRIDFLWIRSRGRRIEIRDARLFGLPKGFAPAASDHFGVRVELVFE